MQPGFRTPRSHADPAAAAPHLSDRGARSHLVVDPGVGLLEPVVQADTRLPAETPENHSVVAGPTAHSHGSVKVIATENLDTGDLLNDVNKLVDRHKLAA